MSSEYEQIVEYCYHKKQRRFVVRFLDGSSYNLKVEDLPQKLQTKKPVFAEAELADDRAGLLITAGNDTRLIPSHIIHSRGKLL